VRGIGKQTAKDIKTEWDKIAGGRQLAAPA
jgi:hypothetical protein